MCDNIVRALKNTKKSLKIIQDNYQCCSRLLQKLTLSTQVVTVHPGVRESSRKSGGANKGEAEGRSRSWKSQSGESVPTTVHVTCFPPSRYA